MAQGPGVSSLAIPLQLAHLGCGEVGWATARIARASPTDGFAIAAVFVVRNVGIATVIAVTILGRVEFAMFATAYFLVQAPILFVAAIVFRCMRGRRVQFRRC